MVRTRLIVAGMLLAAAACSSSNNMTTPTSVANDLVVTSDVAMAAADGVAEDVDVMTGMNGNVGNISANISGSFTNGRGSWRPGLSGCTFAGGSFTCPDTLKNGLNVTRVITLQDASGATQSAYDSLLTASIHIVADISGDRTHGPWTATVARHRDITISGLAGMETSRTVNGTGNETVSQSRVTANGNTRSYTITGSSTITNVVMPVRTADGGNGWPTSGTITRTMTITLTSGPNAGKTVTKTITITFDGTSTPSGSIDGHMFTIDLIAHTATPQG
jgi:hypothetical protein